MRKRLLVFLIAGLSFTACTNSITLPKPSGASTAHYQKPTPEKEARFHETMKKVALSTKDNPKYHRMALDTPEKKTWFKSLMYRLWDRQITRSQFIAEGLEKYPTHRYEFEFIANGFQKHS
jgi:hypothetical protein